MYNHKSSSDVAQRTYRLLYSLSISLVTWAYLTPGGLFSVLSQWDIIFLGAAAFAIATNFLAVRAVFEG